MEHSVLSTTVYRLFGGRDCRFELRLGEIRELERIRTAGIGTIYKRVAFIDCYADDVRETIRLGLIGGGTAHAEATAMMQFAFDGQPLNSWVQLAADILKAAFEGVQPGNGEGERKTSDSPATSPLSTEPAVPSVSPRETSTN
jgi:hypothetical protein